ncbi:I78 family peptidase inhibitor [Aurantiacibacter sp. MUD11]|uniref:I78 family peptidase inhibitor n=1 Tax=Aurantiacibacter sp. MUD11 TaxID=3003265 RepID=UPI0022AA4EF9|nr:I78 family peptidase inhibitor [Aurantiacibacter sp. MUD11]WAT17621.1 I78 family peptidase inhibitor [Aurantiacibacter sp. MUD11]
MRKALIPFAPLAIAACAATAPPLDEDGNPPVREPAGECDAEAAQHLVGATASPDLGAELLELTGARTLRWVPPRTAVTMDFRPDRLTVSYDDDMTIERITCG